MAPVNDPPVAIGDTATLEEGATLSIDASALLANDSDADNDALQVSAVGDAVNGTVLLDGAAIIYKHDGSETDTTSFGYTVTDGAHTATGMVTVTVTPVNDPPVAVADTATLHEGGTLSLDMQDLLANDSDAEDAWLEVSAVGDAVNGAVSLDGTTIPYEHDGSETPAGSLTVSDGADTATAMVTITVTAVNDPPVAVDDIAAVEEGATLSITAALLANDTDAENDPLRISAVGDAVDGTVSLDGTTITYEHDGSETASGSFTYTVSGGEDTTAAIVTIRVTPVNDPPVAAGTVPRWTKEARSRSRRRRCWLTTAMRSATRWWSPRLAMRSTVPYRLTGPPSPISTTARRLPRVASPTPSATAPTPLPQSYRSP